MLFAGVFFGFVGYVAGIAGGWSETWWAYGPLWLLAAGFLWTVVNQLRHRKDLAIEITEQYLCTCRVAVTRKEVAAARRYSDLMFKGVRLDLIDGRWLGIPHHQCRPRKVLRALRMHGYPITK